MKKNRGFTLIELLVVMAFIGIMLAITLGYGFRNKDRINLKNDANEITGQIYKIKQRTARENRTIRMTFTSNSYSCFSWDGANWQEYLKNAPTAQNVTISNPTDFCVNSRGLVVKPDAPNQFELLGTQIIKLRSEGDKGIDEININLYPYGGIKVEKDFK